MARRHLRQAHDRPDRRASPAQELSCRGRNQYRVRARPAGAPSNPTTPSLERRPRDPFAHIGWPTLAWRRCSKIRSAPRSLSRPDGLSPWSPWGYRGQLSSVLAPRHKATPGPAPAQAIPFLKRFTVFNAAQCDNLPEDVAIVAPPPPPGLIEPQGRDRCHQGGQSRSCRFARRRAKACEKQLTVRGVAQLRGARHQMRSKDAQPSNDLPRFIEPPHLGVACRENTV